MRGPLLDRCLGVARETAANYEDGPPPYSLEPLLDAFGVSELRERLLDRDARLVLENEKLIIEVNSLFPKVRRRLSAAHELGHLIINACAGRSRLHISHSDPVEESYCNRLAGELLAPGAAVRRYFAASPALSEWRDAIRCSTLLASARSFDLSVDVMARRVFQDLGLAPSRIAIIWRNKHNTTVSESKRSLRISSVWHSLQPPLFIPVNKTAPSKSIIQDAFESGQTLCGEERFALGGLKGSFAVEATSFGPIYTAENGFRPNSVLSLFASGFPAVKSSSA